MVLRLHNLLPDGSSGNGVRSVVRVYGDISHLPDASLSVYPFHGGVNTSDGLGNVHTLSCLFYSWAFELQNQTDATSQNAIHCASVNNNQMLRRRREQWMLEMSPSLFTDGKEAGSCRYSTNHQWKEAAPCDSTWSISPRTKSQHPCLLNMPLLLQWAALRQLGLMPDLAYTGFTSLRSTSCTHSEPAPSTHHNAQLTTTHSALLLRPVNWTQDIDQFPV